MLFADNNAAHIPFLNPRGGNNINAKQVNQAEKKNM